MAWVDFSSVKCYYYSDMEHLRSTSRRGYSGRSIFSIVLAALLTVLLWAGALTATPAAAQVQTGASWIGESIAHDGRQYYIYPTAQANESHGLAEGTIYYVSLDQVAGQQNAQKAHLIYFAPGADPPTAQTATYVQYDFAAPDQFSNPTNTTTLEVTPQAESGSYSSCSVDGIGWVICPVSVFLAEAMDWAFLAIANFLTVQPLLVNDTTSALYVAWDVMRSFANVAFIVAFLIIIYSQLTSWGVSNYGLKKLLPRLVVAAILVNMSFYISAIAVDISNIAGYGLQNVLIEIRQDTFGITNQTFGEPTDQTNWSNVTAAVLSGGAVTAGIVGISGGTGGTLLSVVPMLVLLLTGLLLTLLFVLLILAARQAIIIILIVISPLAFVANLLPNTEKLFDKWRGLFTTMLVFFPAFSLVFGGSQLAGGIIIQNSGGSVIMMIFGMAVQVAPLVITPLLLKLSGSLLGKIAGIINDPRKGLMDRTRNWANDRSKMYRAESLKKPGGVNPFRRIARRMERGNRLVKDRTELANSQFDNQYHDSAAYGSLHEKMAVAGMEKERIENKHKAHINTEASTAGTELNAQNVSLQDAKVAAEIADASLEATNKELRAGEFELGGNVDLEALQQRMAAGVLRLAAEKNRGVSAEYVLQKNIATEMKTNSDLLDIAQGIGGLTARARATASATATLNKLDKEALDNNITLLQSQALEQGMMIKDYTADIVRKYTSASATERALVANLTTEEIEAAFEVQAQEGQMAIFETARESMDADQRILDRVTSRNIGTFKAKGGFHLQANPGLSLQRYIERFSAGDTSGSLAGATSIADVQAAFVRDMNRSRVDTMANTTAENLSGVKFGTYVSNARDLSAYLAYMDMTNPDDVDTLTKIHATVQIALEDDGIYSTITDRLKETRHIDEVLSRQLGKTPIPKRPSEL